MARRLGGVAHLTSLRRVRIGSLTVAESVSGEDLEGWESRLISPAQALRDLPKVVVGEETAAGVRHGVRFVAGEILDCREPGPYRVTDQSGDLLAVYRRSGDWAMPEVVLPA
jgi:tRNA U55 pseudouridine synthase TruB